MNKPKWTAGPWDAMPHGRVIGSRTVELVGGTVRTQVAMVTANEIDVAEQQANTCLIAASPDLFAALTGMLAMFDASDCACEPPDDDGADMTCNCCIARRALAKARGEV